MGMEMIQQHLPLGFMNGVEIPRRRRSCSVESKPEEDEGVEIPRRRRSCSVESKAEEDEEEGSISMREVATIMMGMGNGGLCKRKRKKCGRGKQRKKPRGKEMSPAEMPGAMRDGIVGKGGYEIELVIEKKLEESDVNRNNGRLSLPAKKVRREFLREEERKVLDEENGNKKKMKNGMEVGIVDSVLRETSMRLKKWKIGSGKVYCLVNNWNSFVVENGLKSGDFIQLWSFRINNSDRLCFAIAELSTLL